MVEVTVDPVRVGIVSGIDLDLVTSELVIRRVESALSVVGCSRCEDVVKVWSRPVLVVFTRVESLCMLLLVMVV